MGSANQFAMPTFGCEARSADQEKITKDFDDPKVCISLAGDPQSRRCWLARELR
jgi:hypothetical protein